MAKIIIKRNKSFCGCMFGFDVYLLNTYIGKLKVGGRLAIDVDVGSHTLIFKYRSKFNTLPHTSFVVVVNEPDEVIIVESGFGMDGHFFVSYTDNDNAPHIKKTFSSSSAHDSPFANTYKNNATNKNSAHPLTSGLLNGFGSCLGELIFLLVVIVLIVNACSSKNNSTLSKDNILSSGQTSNVSSSGQTKNNDNSEKGVILYSDDDFEIKYLSIYDPYDGLFTWYAMKLELTNRSDKNILISLEEAYVNDYLIEIWGGNVDFDGTAPGKKSVCTFILNYDNTVIENLDDIKKIEFKVKLENADDWNDVLLETKTLTIKFR